MEMHLVHQSDEGEYAVVGVMLERGAENSAYAPVWSNIPAKEGEPETISGVTVDATSLLPSERTYYRYNGSFTTPPCTEGVKWFVMNHSVALSDAQVDAFKQIYDGNYRPVLPFNARVFNPSPQAVAAEPVVLPETGGTVWPWESVLMGLGTLTAAAGLHIRRRKAA